MKKFFFSTLMLLVGIITVCAQGAPQFTPLPLKAEVKHGVLPNGLNYYILHNEEPKERANFYIAQKVGSTLETQEQLGLAHFLEHMAFNGTTHYPGKAMLNYLQAKGIRFGADINAYTSFDETVYNIDNVPTTDKPLMDSVLLVIRDWCDGIALAEDEINAERGVINEEWRSRNDARTRQFTAILPQIYKEYQYQQMPIGSMDVVMNFAPETLRAYYRKWYRPDQQGIVIVGDFDADEMEKKVKELFGTVNMPENAAPRTYPEVSDNEEPVYATFSDKELQYATFTLSFKFDKTPFDIRNTVEAYIQDNLMENIVSSMIQNRLDEAALKPECTFYQSGVYFSDFYVSKTKGSFNVVVIPKTDNMAAFKEVLEIVTRACKTGFTATELDRVRTEMLASYEKMFNERNKTTNSSFGNEIIRHFIDNEPAPGIEAEYELVKNVLPMLPVDAYNAMAKEVMTPNNQVIVASVPDNGSQLPTRDEVIKTVNDVLNGEYEAYVDEVITEPLIAKLPKPGKIKKETPNTVFDATEFTLSNGARVIVKKTDFKADEIQMQAYREGGLRTFPASDAANAQMLSTAFECSKWGNFDANKMQKFLAGKKVSLSYSLNNYTDVFTGTSTVKDFPTLMEMIYTAFTNMNPDEQTYAAQVSGVLPILKQQEKDPNFIFNQKVNKMMYNDNPLKNVMTASLLESADYQQMMKTYKQRVANAADYTFIFVGNVDIETLRPMLEQYIASLPSKKKPSKLNEVTPLALQNGDVSDVFKQEMQSPISTVFDVRHDKNVPFNVKNDIMMSMVGEILDMVYIETLREEEGGTYGAAVNGYINQNSGDWILLYQFQTQDEKLTRMLERADKELMDLLNKGAKEDHFNKVKEAAIKQFEIQSRKNGFWMNEIFMYARGYNSFSGYEETLKALTLPELNEFMKKLYNGQNRIQVVMDGEPASK